MSSKYCLIYKDNEPLFGFIRENRKNKVVIQPQRGSEIVVNENHIEYVWTGEEHPANKTIQEFLEQKFNQTTSEMAHFQIETVWELCEPEAQKTHEFTELYENFLDNPADEWKKIAFYLALKQDGRYFRFRKGKFIPRSEEEIEIFDRQTQKAHEIRQTEILFEKWINQLKSSTAPLYEAGEENIRKKFETALVKLASERENFTEPAIIRRLLSGYVENTAKNDVFFLEVLSLINVHISWGALQIMKAGVRREFPEGVLQQAEELVNTDQLSNWQEITDETQAFSYTVDGSETKDFDDAISVEYDNDQTIIRVHIADVACMIESGSALWKESERRLSSVYTLKQNFPMLPQSLSEDKLSLIADKERRVITYFWKLDAELNILERHIYPSRIKVRENLSYHALDEIIQTGTSPEWDICLKFAEKLRAERMENGAVNIMRNEVKVDISNPENIRIFPVDENTPAHKIIEELAVAVNCFTGEYLWENNVQGFYRYQEPYTLINNAVTEDTDTPENKIPSAESTDNNVPVSENSDNSQTGNMAEINMDSTDSETLVSAEEIPPIKHSEKNAAISLNDIIIRSAKIGISPSRHYGLGVDCYMQATSPIRRFQDLYNQHRLIKRLSDNVETPDEMLMIAKANEIEICGKKFSFLERTLIEHWKFKYLAQNIGIVQTIEFQRTLRNGNTLLFFPEIDMQYEFAGNQKIDRSVTAKITSVNVPEHQIVFEILENEPS